MNKFLKFWIPVIIWMAVIFTFSSIPDLKSGLEQDFLLRKIAHILEYLILTFLLIRALIREGLNIRQIIIYALIFALFYALSDEYHQTFVLGRSGSLRDVGIDSIGILLMSFLWYIRNKRIKIK